MKDQNLDSKPILVGYSSGLNSGDIEPLINQKLVQIIADSFYVKLVFENGGVLNIGIDKYSEGGCPLMVRVTESIDGTYT